MGLFSSIDYSLGKTFGTSNLDAVFQKAAPKTYDMYSEILGCSKATNMGVEHLVTFLHKSLKTHDEYMQLKGRYEDLQKQHEILKKEYQALLQQKNCIR